MIYHGSAAIIRAAADDDGRDKKIIIIRPTNVASIVMLQPSRFRASTTAPKLS